MILNTFRAKSSNYCINAHKWGRCCIMMMWCVRRRVKWEIL